MSKKEENVNPTAGAGKKESTKPETKESSTKKLENLVTGLVKVVGDLSDRMEQLETGGANDFQKESNSEDIETANEMRKDVDPRICKVVDEILGADFGIKVKPSESGVGFLFTVIVPERLSDRPLQQRPILNAKTGKYKVNMDGSKVYETYKPADERSRMLSTADSFGSVREHCIKVQSNIVAYYQKMKKPLPAFNTKNK